MAHVPSQRDAFLACLAKDLPVAFRINGSGRFADHLRDKFESDFFSHFAKGDLKVRGCRQKNGPRL